MLENVESLMHRYVEEADAYALSLYEKVPRGKRLRAKLILRIAGENAEAERLAAIVELIHAASLLHDDVIDEAMTRRGIPSINATHDSKSAVMLGDILYSKAYSELSRFAPEIIRRISDAVVQLSAGELLDVEYAKVLQPDEAKYFDMIYKKTAVLIEATAASAAALAGKPTQSFARYGKNLGLAFQIIDDVLDITADAQTLGKPAMADFREGKTTLPYIYLFEALDEAGRERLRGLYRKSLTEEEAAWLKEKMRESGAVMQSITLAQQLGRQALDAIAHERNPALERVITDMIEREF
ncbi:MAG TPA: polyprenyl synthetase family protein [Campylobacteraceae bacterium]|nr:polyprenyl synthetase family protein [Campylobacteraceae bacterium]